MSDLDEAHVRTLARKYALQNAVQHGSDANAGAVTGKILGSEAALRPHSKTLMPWVADEVAAVNAMEPGAQKTELESLDPSLLERKKKERGHPFKQLPGWDETDHVVMRFAPNPNGPATLGHSRGMVTMNEYKLLAEQAGKRATLILRFDDTDPQVKPPYPPAYDWLKEDYEWLGATVDRVVRASDRIDEYYQVAHELIGKGAAYVCFCSQAAAKAFRDAATPCPHRDIAPAESMQQWKGMLDGTHADGTATLRIKTQVDHKDPAQRDWVGMRIVSTPHPMVGTKYRVWPMLDFESAVEDHLQGVTHIIRGKDLRDSTHRQRYLYTHMGWTYPHTLYWGRVRLDELGRFSSSGMRAEIEAGKYSGWDDPRLPTLRALRRRGITPEGVRAFWVGMGLSEKDVAASLTNLYAENEKVIESRAGRLFFVHGAAELTVRLPEGHDAPMDGNYVVAYTPVHPDHSERGQRTQRAPVRQDAIKVFLCRQDLMAAGKGAMLRLKDLGNVMIDADHNGHASGTWMGDDLGAAREAKAPIVQWLPVDPAARIPCTVLRPEPSETNGGIRHEGYVERAVLDAEPDDIVQFERYGFVRLEQVDEDTVHAVFAHR